MRNVVKLCALTILIGIVAVPMVAQTEDSAAASVQKAVNADGSTAYFILQHPRVLASFLGLSATQTTSLLGFWSTFETTVQPLWQARQPLCAQLRSDLALDPADPAAVGADTISLYTNKQSRLAARGVFDTSLSAILNARQLALYDALKIVAEGADPEYNVIGVCPPASS